MPEAGVLWMGLFDWLFGPPSMDQFAKRLIRAIRRAGETRGIRYNAAESRIAPEEGNDPQLFLANAYLEYRTASKQMRQAILQRWVQFWCSMRHRLPHEFEDVVPDLLPALLSRSYFELNPMRLRLEGRKLPEWHYQILGEHFGIGLVYDLPASMVVVNQKHLDQWGVSFYEAMEVARRNLSELEYHFLGPKHGPGTYLSASQDKHNATRILSIDIIRQFQVKGELVAMAPNRNTLIVTGTDDVDGLKAMQSLAEDALSKPGRIHGIALRLEGEEWTPWLPEPSHPLFKQFKLLQVQPIGMDYIEQKEILDKLHQKRGEDVFVASYTILEEQETGNIVSHAVWGKDVHTLLPHTDRIAFMSHEQEPVMVDWERAVEVVGNLMEAVDIYPVRCRVREYPSEEQLAAMAGSAEPS
jgi:hypothetical protein